jgi:hypothetical protein
MEEREELKQVLGELKPADREYLRRYVRGSRGLRDSYRRDLQKQGNEHWLRLLDDIDSDESDLQVVAEVLEELEAHSPTGVREIRVLAGKDGQLRRVCKLFFSSSDFSLYVVPYAPGGHYFFGSDSMEEHQVEKTFDFTAQLTSEDTPHVSIHGLGQVHIKDPQVIAGPLRIPPLDSLTGQHIASISVDAFDDLAAFEGTPKAKGPEFDLVIPVDSGVRGGRLAIYVNGGDATFDFSGPTPPVVTLTRQGRELHVAVAPISQPVLGDPGRRGVTVIAGWDPRATADEPMAFLYLRGE